MLRWIVLLLLGLSAGSLLATSVVHAREFSGAPTLECSGVVADADTIDQGDSDDGSDPSPPAQHATCHAPVTSLPPLAVAPASWAEARRDILVRASREPMLDLVDRTIRPPIA